MVTKLPQFRIPFQASTFQPFSRVLARWLKEARRHHTIESREEAFMYMRVLPAQENVGSVPQEDKPVACPVKGSRTRSENVGQGGSPPVRSCGYHHHGHAKRAKRPR